MRIIKLKKNLAGFGVVLGLVAGVGGAFWVIESHWLTSAERGAAQTALTAIDNLQDAGPVSDEDFDAKVDQAEQAVEAAQLAASTSRDQNVAYALMRYLGSTVKEQDTMRMQNRGSAEQGPEFDAQPLSAEFTIRHSLSSSLHQTLN
jgi:hypothetical protein